MINNVLTLPGLTLTSVGVIMEPIGSMCVSVCEAQHILTQQYQLYY